MFLNGLQGSRFTVFSESPRHFSEPNESSFQFQTNDDQTILPAFPKLSGTQFDLDQQKRVIDTNLESISKVDS
jgi:hypothetical protein